VTDSETPSSGTPSAGVGTTPRRRKTTPRKRTTARRKGARTGSRRPASRRAASRSRKASAASLQKVLEGLARRASAAGVRIADLSGEGAVAARRAIGKASTASRRTIDRLTREWQQMDTARKVRFVAALLGALAAASAPLVRKARRK
jgi:hypothetical protein